MSEELAGAQKRLPDLPPDLEWKMRFEAAPAEVWTNIHDEPTDGWILWCVVETTKPNYLNYAVLSKCPLQTPVK